MLTTIGLRREDLNKKGEKRSALSPETATPLLNKGFTVTVQPGIHPESDENKRTYSDEEYATRGARIQEDLSEADVILGLKEIGIEELLPNKTYLFFSHTHKGQKKNRPLLKAMAEKEITLIDYELIAEKKAGRLITAFTYFAGYAGMIDTLWTYGKRLKNHKGIDHPFTAIPQSIEKEDLDGIKEIIRNVGERIALEGTPEELPPLITCVLGCGKTSIGAQEIYDLLPVREIGLNDLPEVFASGNRTALYKVVLEVNQMYRLKREAKITTEEYEKQTEAEQIKLYLEQPEMFESNLDHVLPYISILMNCIIWSPDYPRVLPSALLQEIWQEHPTLQAIGDITCDPNGAIEFSRETWIDNPVYIFDSETGQFYEGFDGNGVAVMAVTNLPCEFSRDASNQFAKELEPFLVEILTEDYTSSFEKTQLPDPIKEAVILWRGEFTPPFAYMEEYVSGM